MLFFDYMSKSAVFVVEATRFGLAGTERLCWVWCVCAKECFARVQTLSLRCGDRLGMSWSMVRIGWLGVRGWVDCRLAQMRLMGIGRAHMLFGSHTVGALGQTVSL